MLRILYITPSVKIGGAERSLLQILSALDQTQFAPIVLIPGNGPLTDKIKKLNIKTVFMPKSLIEAHSIVELSIALLWLHLIVKKHKLSIIHSNSKFCCRLPILYSALFNAKAILHWRDFSLWKDEKNYLGRFQNRLFFFAVSNEVKSFLLENGVKAEKIALSYDGADPSFYEVPPPPLNETMTIAISGRIDNWKGHEYLIEAMGKTKDLPLELLIFGEFHSVNDPGYLDKLKTNICYLGLNDRVRFAGFQKDPASALARVDIVCVPSIFEPYGMVAVEAMAAGRPLIASNTGGLKDIIEENVTGYLVEPKDSEAIALKIRSLHERPELRRKMGAAGRFRARELFGIPEQIKKIEEMYNEIIGNRPDK